MPARRRKRPGRVLRYRVHGGGRPLFSRSACFYGEDGGAAAARRADDLQRFPSIPEGGGRTGLPNARHGLFFHRDCGGGNGPRPGLSPGDTSGLPQMPPVPIHPQRDHQRCAGGGSPHPAVRRASRLDGFPAAGGIHPFGGQTVKEQAGDPPAERTAAFVAALGRL